MEEVVIGGNTYRIGKIDVIKQFHVARRLAAVLTECGPLLMAAMKANNGEQIEADPLKLFEPMAKAVGALTDTDADYVIKTCLSVVSRQQGDRWAIVQAPNGKLMFEDIELPTMINIVGNVIRVNLANFTLANAPTLAARPPAA